jgi:hypothetical protein
MGHYDDNCSALHLGPRLSNEMQLQFQDVLATIPRRRIQCFSDA